MFEQAFKNIDAVLWKEAGCTTELDYTQQHELSHLYEAKIKNMGNAGRNGGEYYTPRPLIRTGEVLDRFELPLPPLPYLCRAVAKFEEFSVETQHLASLYQQKLAALEELKTSLLHQAFIGQL